MEGKITAISASKRAAVEKVVRRVLLDSKPSAKESAALVANANEVMSRLTKIVPRNIEIIFVGSGARGTQMRGRDEIDIFLLFPRKTSRQELERKGLEYGKRIVDKKGKESFVIKYAEHPYVQVYLREKALKADIVPAYKIDDSSQMGSSVDRTQLHNNFVISHLSRRQRDEVIVLKAFLQSHGIYGANVRVEGFSGYLCELLVCQYGSFIDTITAFSSLHLPAVVDLISKGIKAPSADEMKKRFGSDFMVIDPTDRNRNVAANVSNESLAKFALASRAFLRSPSTSTFYPRGHSTIASAKRIGSAAKSLGVDIYTISFKLPDMTEEILWQQLQKLRGRIELELVKSQFGFLGGFQNISGRDAIVSFMIRSGDNKHIIVKGPNPIMAGAAEAFLESHRGAEFLLFAGDRVVSVERPKFANPSALLKRILSQKDVNFPSYISRKSARLYTNDLPEHYAKMLHEAIEEKMVHR